jgi:hypothetical protein
MQQVIELAEIAHERGLLRDTKYWPKLMVRTIAFRGRGPLAGLIGFPITLLQQFPVEFDSALAHAPPSAAGLTRGSIPFAGNLRT